MRNDDGNKSSPKNRVFDDEIDYARERLTSENGGFTDGRDYMICSHTL